MSFDLKALLNQSSLVVNSTPSPVDIDENIHARAKNKKTIRVMYGETYDRLGHTFDSLKYYFYVAAVGNLLRKEGVPVEPTILVADVATCRNEPESRHAELMELGKGRANFVREIDETYHLGLNVILMSEYLFTDEFQEQVSRVRKLADVNKEVFNWIEQTVPASKVEIENDKGFAYAFDEVATIINYDLKVGPPREIFYDEPARRIGQAMGLEPLQCVYLHPTFPLAMNRGFFLKDEEVAQYGVTPYKAGSRGLETNRIVLGQTSIESVVELVNNSIVSYKPTMPNPVLDLVVISEMAHQYMNGEVSSIDIRERFFDKTISTDQLKQTAIENVTNYVLNPLDFVIQGEKIYER